MCVAYREILHFEQTVIIFEDTRLTHLITLFWLFPSSSREEIKDRHISSPYHRRTYHLTQNDSQDASAEQRYTLHSDISPMQVSVSSVNQVLCYTCFSSTFAQFMLSIHLNFASACSAVLPYWGSSKILKSQFKLFNRSVMWCVWPKNRVQMNIYDSCKINVSAGVW